MHGQQFVLAGDRGDEPGVVERMVNVAVHFLFEIRSDLEKLPAFGIISVQQVIEHGIPQ